MKVGRPRAHREHAVPNPNPDPNPNPKQVGLEVDTAGFQAAMEEQKARSAAAAAASKVHGSG